MAYWALLLGTGSSRLASKRWQTSTRTVVLSSVIKNEAVPKAMLVPHIFRFSTVACLFSRVTPQETKRLTLESRPRPPGSGASEPNRAEPERSPNDRRSQSRGAPPRFATGRHESLDLGTEEKIPARPEKIGSWRGKNHCGPTGCP